MADRAQRACARGVAQHLMQVPAEVQLDVWMRLMAHGHASAELVQLVAALAQTHMRAFVASLLAHAGSLQHHMRDVIRMLRPLARGSADVPDADLHALQTLFIDHLEDPEVQSLLHVICCATSAAQFVRRHMDALLGCLVDVRVCTDNLALVCKGAVVEDPAIFDGADREFQMEAWVARLCLRLECAHETVAQRAAAVVWQQVLACMPRRVPLACMRRFGTRRIILLRAVMQAHPGVIEEFAWLDSPAHAADLCAKALTVPDAMLCLLGMGLRGLTETLATPQMAQPLLLAAKADTHRAADQLLACVLDDHPAAVAHMLALTAQDPLALAQGVPARTGMLVLAAAARTQPRVVRRLCANDVMGYLQAHQNLGELAAKCLLDLAAVAPAYLALARARAWPDAALRSLETSRAEDDTCMRLQILLALSQVRPLHGRARRVLQVVRRLHAPCDHAAHLLYEVGRTDKCVESLALAACYSDALRCAALRAAVDAVCAAGGAVAVNPLGALMAAVAMALEDDHAEAVRAAVRCLVVAKTARASVVAMAVGGLIGDLARALVRRTAFVDVAALLTFAAAHTSPAGTLPSECCERLYEAGGTEALAEIGFGPWGVRSAADAFAAAIPDDAAARVALAHVVVASARRGAIPWAARHQKPLGDLLWSVLHALPGLEGDALLTALETAEALRQDVGCRHHECASAFARAEARAAPALARRERVASWAQRGVTLEVPRAFLCPITLEVMQDPVQASDGNTYERAAVTALFEAEGDALSPLTREVLTPGVLLPNRALAALRDAHVDELLAVADAAAETAEKKRKAAASPGGEACRRRGRVI